MEVQLFTRRLTGGQHGFMSWQWVRPYVNTGFSLVATRRTDKDAVLEALGVDASDSEVLTWDGALEEFPGVEGLVRWGATEGWDWFFQPVGGDFLTALEAQSLSSTGTVLLIAARGAGSGCLVYAADGAMIVHWDTSLTPRVLGVAPERLLPLPDRTTPGSDSASNWEDQFDAERVLDLVSELLHLRITDEVVHGPAMTGEFG